MKRIAGVILAGGMILGAAGSAKAQLAISVGNPYGYGVNPYGYGYGVPATTYYSSGYSGFGVAPFVGAYPSYGYRPYGGFGGYGYRSYGYRPAYGYRNYGGFNRGGYGRGFGYGGRRR